MEKVSYILAIESLMYIMIYKIPNIIHVIGVINRYIKNPKKMHWKALKLLLQFFKGTSNLALCFKKNSKNLQGFTTVNLDYNLDSCRKKIDFIFTLRGSNMSWISKLQKNIILLSTKVKYIINFEGRNKNDFFEEIFKSFN